MKFRKDYYFDNKDLIYDLYIVKNLSYKKIANMFNVSNDIIKKILKKYDIKKFHIVDGKYRAIKGYINGASTVCIKCGKDLFWAFRKYNLCRFCYSCKCSTKFKDMSFDDDMGNWISGFTDGEGNFNWDTKKRAGAFRIILREDDKAILESIRYYFGVGKLYYRDISNKSWNNGNQRNQWNYSVYPIVDLINVIIPHFDKYKLRAKKRIQYEIWKEKVLKQWENMKHIKIKGGDANAGN